MLIIVSKSLSQSNYDSIVQIAAKTIEKGEKTAILHIQDSCINVTMRKYCDTLQKKGIDIYVLKDDCQKQGLVEKLGKNVKTVDYKGWVELLMDKHNKIVSWTT